ncbi:MAG: hypothetical protein KME22_14425, partial [Hassallia sp. WJT32-NPBG1]|nr:hypothetical protein [Hassallia sp. WJT32-NPBG1]
IVIKLFSSATKTSGCSCVYRVVAWRAARLHRAIACDSCVSPVYAQCPMPNAQFPIPFYAFRY